MSGLNQALLRNHHPQGKRMRVCKACDRCRMRKSKCDGIQQCSKCKTDDTICTFTGTRYGDRREYPPGYVEALEQQHKELVSDLRRMYKRLRDGQVWSQPEPPELDVHPLPNDNLAPPNSPVTDEAESTAVAIFEEHCLTLESRPEPDAGAIFQPVEATFDSKTNDALLVEALWQVTAADTPFLEARNKQHISGLHMFPAYSAPLSSALGRALLPVPGYQTEQSLLKGKNPRPNQLFENGRGDIGHLSQPDFIARSTPET